MLKRCEVTTNGHRCPRVGLRFIVRGLSFQCVARICKSHRADMRGLGYTLELLKEFATANGRKENR